MATPHRRQARQDWQNHHAYSSLEKRKAALGGTRDDLKSQLETSLHSEESMSRHIAQTRKAHNTPVEEDVPFRRLPEPQMIAIPLQLARDHSISHLARSILIDWLSRTRESELTAQTIMIRFALSSEQAAAVFSEIKGTPYVR
jgi:hypothetical protein